MIKRLNYILLVAVLAFSIKSNAQTTTSESTYKGFSITANASGGICSYLFWSDTFIQAGGGVGFRYDFSRFWGIYTSLDYESVFKQANHEDYHLSFGIGLNAWTAANAKECFNIGETVLELGGRIPLTTSDILTIGINTNISVGFTKVYFDGVAHPGVSTDPPRFGAVLKLGYEHRF